MIAIAMQRRFGVRPSGGHNMALSPNARATFRVGRRAGRRKKDLPEGRSKDSVLLSRSCSLCRWFCVGLGSFPRFLLRRELLLDLESHGIGINAVCLGRCAENFASV